MKNLAQQPKSYSQTKFFSEFSVNPITGYYRLLSNYKNYRHTPSATKFWQKWMENRKAFSIHSSREVVYYADRIDQLKLLVDFETALKKDKELIKKRLSGRDLSKERFLVQSLCLTQRGWQGERYKFDWPVSDVLAAYKLIEKDDLFSGDNTITFTNEDSILVERLLEIYVEHLHLEKLFRYFVLGDYEVKQIGFVENQYINIYSLQLKKDDRPETNSYLLSRAKQKIKEKLIKRTAETELKLSKDYEEEIARHEDLLKQAMKQFDPAAISLLMYVELEKEGLVSYRDTINNIYFPQEEINVNRINIGFKGHKIPLLHVIYALGALSSYATQYIIADNYNNLGILMAKSSILQIFTHFKEWRDLNLNEKAQNLIVDLLLSVNNRLPYSPIIQTGQDEFLIAPLAFFENGGFERLFYNYVITDILYQQDHEEKNQKEHQVRADAVAGFLANKIANWPGVKVCADFKWPRKEEYWSDEGQTDLVIYFEKENLLFLIEIKLCNTLSKSQQLQIEWVNKKVLQGKESAAYQLEKDLLYFRNKEAYPHIATSLNLDKTKAFNPKIFSLILTDVFFIDGEKITINLNDDEAKCISIFEFSNLLEGRTNFNSENSELPTEARGKWLTNRITNNEFWKGINITKDIRRDFACINKCESIPHKIDLSTR